MSNILVKAQDQCIFSTINNDFYLTVNATINCNVTNWKSQNVTCSHTFDVCIDHPKWQNNPFKWCDRSGDCCLMDSNEDDYHTYKFICKCRNFTSNLTTFNSTLVFSKCNSLPLYVWFIFLIAIVLFVVMIFFYKSHKIEKIYHENLTRHAAHSAIN